MQSSSTPIATIINEWADFWRHQIGVNVIPANTIEKKPVVPWEQWQGKPIPEEIHDQWKEHGKFSKGIAIIPGKIWHRPDKQDLYFTFLDADKSKAINELCTINGEKTTLQKMAQKFIVEQHKDNLEKAHIYFYSPIPFPKKSAESVVGLEVKGLGEHGIAYCTSSIHQSGQPYEIIGTTDPTTLTEEQAKEMMQHINSICKKYGIEYLDKYYKNLLDSGDKIYQGARHDSMISIANSILFRYGDNGKSEQELNDTFADMNNKRSVPPLPTNEINQIWKDAVAYYTKKKNEEAQQQPPPKHEDKKKKSESADDEQDKAKKPFYIQKYSKDVSLTEAVIINRQPLFLQVINNNGNPVLVDKLELNDIILYPKETHSYPNIPYDFKSKDEIAEYLDLAKNISNFDQIFKLVKNIFKKYVDAEDHYITILAADTLYSYFQDKFATTHYLICIGDNSSGKNSILTTFAYLGYRVFLATSVSAANVYTFLGSVEDCQGTLAEDELNNLENDPDKMNVHKSGYSRSSGRIPKIDLHSGRVQEVYLTYCFKIFASELSPDSSKAKGILDRSFIINCIAGRPQYNIKEVFENSNDVEHVKLRNELDKTRKLLLAYRMLHQDDIIKDVNLNIYNREAELTKPLIRLFRESPEVLKELLPALSKLLNAKRKVKSYSLEAKLYTAVSNLVPSNPDYIIGHSAIIEEVRKITNGQLSPHGEQAFYTTDLSKVTHRRIIDTLVDKFKAVRTSKGSGDEKERALQFKIDDLEKKGKEYDVPDEIKILPSADNNVNSDNNPLNEPDSFDAIFQHHTGDRERASNGNGTEGTQGTEFSDKGEGTEQSRGYITNNKSAISDNVIENFHYNAQDSIENHEGDPCTNFDNTSTYPVIPSQSSHSNSNQLEPSEHLDSSNDIFQPIISIEEFFKDDPDAPWYIPPHELEQSPCRHIIHKKGQFYSCKLHPKEANNIYLDAVEQHCKYKHPELHKAELLKYLNLSENKQGS